MSGYLSQYKIQQEHVWGQKRHLLAQKIFSGYVKRLGQKDYYGLFLPRILKLFNIPLDRHLTVLEIGAGSGVMLSFKYPNIRYIAVDRESVFKEKFEKEGMQFFELDISKQLLPIADKTVDIVLMNHVIEHIENTGFLLREIYRVVRGGVYIRTPNIEKVKYKFWDDWTHVKPFTPLSLESAMKAHGFCQHFMFRNSDWSRMLIDIATDGMIRKFLFSTMFGGKEIEAGFFANNAVLSSKNGELQCE